MRLPIRRVAATLALLLASGLTLVAPASAAVYATVEGTGSTWAQTIVDQWISDVDARGIKAIYTGGGSTKGRKDFAQNSVDFAISELPYQGVDETGQSDTSDGRAYTYVPIVAGGTAFTYQLKVGDQLVRNLRLSGRTLAKIFTGAITSWHDPAITADNNGRVFPDKVITPVVRSDGSGTTKQLTAWMDASYPAIWRSYYGSAGSTAYYPRTGNMVAQAGSDQVMNTISGFAGDGTIGYVENSYPANKDYPVVQVLNAAGYYVAPTADNTAVALTGAQVADDQTQVLDGVYTNPDPRAYPLSSYSYLILPTGADDARMTTAKRQSLADLTYYSLCAGQAKAGPYGYAPLPRNLVQAGLGQVAQLKQADPAVDLADHDPAHCDNPTFDKSDPDRDLLDEIAPMPAPCDQQGEGPCGTDTSPGTPTTPGNPAVVTGVTLSAPHLASGVYVVNPRRHYVLTVRTTSSKRPHYLHAVPRSQPFRGSGKAMKSAGRSGGKRVWSLRVQIDPRKATRKIGVRVGPTVYVALVRRA